ncbi:MAG TPA: hypothetical protein VGI40_02525, partial [Pirellulaceae bacterium]
MFNAATNVAVGTLFDSTTGTTSWNAASVTAPFTGSFYLVFEAGSDDSGNTQIGASLDIDAIHVPQVTTVGLDGLGNLNVLDVTSGGKNDNITISLNGPNVRLVDPDNQLTATFGATQIDANTVEVPLASITGSIHVMAGNGNDRLTVNDTNGVIKVPGGIQYDGGDGIDTLTLTGTTSVTTTYSVGPGPSDGKIEQEDNSENTQVIQFTGLEPVLDTTPGTATVNGTNADNAISYTQGSSAANGLVAVDAYETFEFSNKSTLTINGQGGDDTISLNNPSTPNLLTGITVNGGDPTADTDTVVANGTAGTNGINFSPTSANAGTITGAGPVAIALATTERLTINGQGGSDALTYTTPAGLDRVTYDTGAIADQGTLSARQLGGGADLLGLSFTNLGAAGSLTVADAGLTRSDDLVVNGTAGDDQFNVSAVGTGNVQIVTNPLTSNVTVPINTPGLRSLTLNGLSGDDSFNIPGNHPFSTGVFIEGGDPSASDVVNFTGTAGPITVDLTSNTIQQNGSGAVSLNGTEQVNINANAAVVVTGTASSDTFNVQPTAAGAGNFTVSSAGGTAYPVFNYTNATSLTVNGGTGGFDTLAIVGDDSVDTVSANATTVTRNGGAVTFGTNLDQLNISTLGGNDSVTLTGAVPIPAVVDAGAGDDTVDGSGLTSLTNSLRALGGAGNDTLAGGPANDTLDGGDGNDTITGGPGADQMTGGSGSDTFIWNQGGAADSGDANDVVDGGDGIDQFNFNGAAAGQFSNEHFVLTATNPTANVGSHLSLQRTEGPVNLDIVGVEDVNFPPSTGADTFLINDLTNTDVRTVNLGLNLGTGAENVIVNGRNADDNLLISNSTTLTGQNEVKVEGLSYDVNVVLPNVGRGDTLTVNGNDGNDTITATGPTQLVPGVASRIGIILNGGAGDDYLSADGALNGNEGDDTLVGGAGNNAMDGGSGDDTFIGNGGTDAIGGGAGASVGDTILLPGTSGDDTFNLALDATGNLVATINGVATTYTNFLAGPISTSGIEQILVQGGAGADLLTVNSGNGAIPIPVNFDGGDDADSLVLTGGTATLDNYSPGPSAGAGTSTIFIGGVPQVVTFSNLEPVIDTVAGPMTVTATPANNAINFSGSLISVDNFETISIVNKTDVTINAGSGSDTINLNGPTGFSGAIAVNGGDPTASDTLILNGTGDDTIAYRPDPVDPAAGTVVVNGSTRTFTGIENVVINGGNGSDTLNLFGNVAADAVVLTPTGNGGGTVQFNNSSPVTFTSFETATVDTDGGANDSITVNATDNNDVVSVGGLNLSVNNQSFIIQNEESVTVNLGNGDDVVTAVP